MLTVYKKWEQSKTVRTVSNSSLPWSGLSLGNKLFLGDFLQGGIGNGVAEGFFLEGGGGDCWLSSIIPIKNKRTQSQLG